MVTDLKGRTAAPSSVRLENCVQNKLGVYDEQQLLKFVKLRAYN